MKIFTLFANCKKTVFAGLAVLCCLMMKSEVGWGQTTTCTSAPSITVVYSATTCTPTTTFNITGIGTGPAFTTCTGATNATNNWGKFTAIAPTATIVYDPATGQDAMIFAYSGTCGGTLTQIGCIDNGSGGAAESLSLTGLTPGTTYYFRIVRWNSTSAMSGAICISSPNPTITTGTISGSPFCAGNTSASLSVPYTTSAATFGSGNTFTAQLSNAAGSFAAPTNIGSITSVANSGNIPAVIPAGTPAGTGYRIRVVSSNPAVTGSSNTVNLTINNPAAPTGSSPQTFCASANPTVANLSATGTGVQWYAAATGGSPLAASTALVNGTHYYASQTVSSCEGSARLDVTATVSNPSAPTGSASQSFCANANPTIANLVATGTGLKWYAAANGGTALATSTPLVNGTHYYASQTVGGCEGTSRLDVTVTLTDPAAPTGSATQNFCAINNPTVANLVASGTLIKWYTAPTGGTLLTSGTALVNGTHYYASQTISGCESSSRLDVTAVVSDPAAPTGNGTQSFCAINNPTVADLVAAGTSIKWYSAATGGTALPSTTSLVNGTHYYASQTVGSCESTNRLDVTAIVGNPAAPTGSATQTFCSDANPTVANLTATGTAIQWYAAATGGTALANTTALVNNMHYYASQTVSGCESAIRFDVTVTINNPISITTQPNPSQTICASYPVTFTVVATGNIAGYQWYKGTTALTDNSNISGSQTATLNLDQAYPADAGLYHVVVLGTAPCGDVTSADAELIVNQNIVITTQPSPQTVCTGSTATFSVTATGTGLTYQWYHGATALTDGGNISGAATSTLSISNVSAPSDAGNYKVVISDGSAGCPNVNSVNAALTISATSVGGTVNGSATVCSGTNNGTLTLTGKTGNVVRWEYSTDGGTTWTTIANTTTSQTYTNLTQTTQYRAVVQSGVCPEDNSVAATITVNAVIANNTIAADQTICSGSAPASLTGSAPTGGSGTYTYLWESSTTSATAGFSAAAGTNNGQNYTPGTLTQTTWYRRTVISGPCANNVSTAIQITVNPVIANNTIAAPQTMCTGSTPAPLTGSAPTGGSGTYTYLWESSTTSATAGFSAATGTNNGQNYTPGTLTQTTWYRRTVISGPCANNVSTAIQITVNPVIANNTIAAPQTICTGSTPAPLTGSAPTGGSGTYTYLWESSTTSATAGFSAATGTNNGQNYTPGTLTQTTWFRRTVISGPCANNVSTAIQITVNPVIANNTIAAPQTICTGSTPAPLTGSAPTGGSGTYTYLWESSTTSATAGFSAASGTNNGQNYTLGTLTQTTWYRRTVISGPCANNVSTAIQITVNPVIANNTIAADQTICSGSAPAPLTGSAPTGGSGTYTYLWESSTTSAAAGFSAAAGTNNGQNYTPGTLTQTTWYRRTVISGPCANNVSTAIQITVNAVIASNTIAAPQTICTGSTPAGLTGSAPTGGNGTYTYLWQSSTTSGTTGFAAAAGTNNGQDYTAGALTTTTWYRRIVTSGPCSNTSTAIQITVNQNIGNNTVAASQTICTGSAPAPLTGSAPTGGGGSGTYTYLWESSTTSATAGFAAATGTNNGQNYTPGALTTTTWYRRTVISGPCANNVSTAIQITVNPVIANNTIAADQTICSGTTPAPLTGSTPTGGNGTYTYNWERSTTSATAGFGNAPGVRNGQNYTPGALTQTTWYRRTVISGPCANNVSTAIQITVHQPISNNTIAASDTICSGSTPAPLTGSTPAGGNGTYTYLWESSTTSATAGFAAAAGTNNGQNYTPGALTQTTWYRRTVISGPCANNVSTAIKITVSSIPAGTFTASETSGNANNDNTICAGDNVKFTATDGNTYNFKVDGVSVQNGTSGIYNTNTLSVGTHLVTVDVANGNNCGATYGPITITVNPLPSPTLTVTESSGTPNDNTICSGANVTLTATGGTTYSFIINGSTVATGASNTYSTTAITSTSTVAVTVTNANGCQATSAPQTITVSSVPSGTLSFTENSGTTPNDKKVCVGDPVTFTATAGFSSYTFKINGVPVAGSPSASNVYTTSFATAGNPVVTVDATNSNGCTGSFSPSITMQVFALPTGSITVSENSGVASNDNTICSGASVTFRAPTSFSNYKFYLNGTGAPVQDGASRTYITSSLANGDYITVLVANSNGCSSTFTSPTITVVPAPSGTLTASDTIICAGEEIDFTATAGFDNYNFKRNGVSFQNGSSNTASYDAFSDGDKVTVDVSNSQTCAAIFDTLTIHVDPLPTGTLTPVENSGSTANDGIICAGDSIVFTATTGYANYDFKLNGTTVQYSSSNTYTNYTLADGDIVGVEVTSAAGCVATFNNDTIAVHPYPTVAAITGAVEICAGSSTPFADATPGGVWGSDNTSVATVDASGVVTGVAAGTATISYAVTNANGCTTVKTKSIAVNALPVVAAITGNFNICTGSTSQLSDATTGGVWSSDNSSIATVNATGLVTGIAAGTDTIRYAVTDANGCTTTVSVEVTVSSSPSVAPITTTAPSFDVCIGSAITLKDATAGGVWSSDNTSVATINASGVVTGVAAGTATISYTITTSCATTVSATQVITVHALPTATISGTTSVCKGGTPPTITFTGANGTAPYTFTYNINGGANQIVTSVGNTATVNAPTGTAGTFTYNLVSVKESSSTACSQAQTGSATVTVNPLPTATISGTTSVCIGSASPNITFTGAGGTAPYTFTYDINGGAPLIVVSNLAGVATVPVPTATVGTYTYDLLSVQDASLTLCSSNQTGSATVTVTPASVGGSVASDATVCSGSNTGTLTLSGHVGNVIRWESSTNGGTTWNSIANITTSLTYTNITVTTMYRAVVQSGNCSSANSSAATITVNPVSAGGSVASDQTVCSGSAPSSNLTLTGYAGSIVKWQKATDAAFTSPIDIANTTATLTIAAIGPLTTTTYFRAVVQSGVCPAANSASAKITVTPAPTATITVSGTNPTCKNAPVTNVVFTGAGGTAPYVFTYKINGGANQTINSVGNTATVPQSTATVGTYTYTLVSVSDAGGCSQTQSGSVTITVNDIPAIYLYPYNSSVCQSDIVPLSATSSVGPPPSQAVASSPAALNLPIPDAQRVFIFIVIPGETSHSLNISGIPAGAIVTNISVKLNVTHTWDGDLNFNLKAPNGSILNLINRDGGNGDNFTNTVISMAATAAIPNNGAPYTGTYKPDAQDDISILGNTSNATSFTQLASVLNGNWTLYAQDANDGDQGVLNNWSITINYQVPSPNPVTWSPITDLYTNATATTPYTTGQSLTTVYFKPSSSGTKTYTATATNASNCTNTAQATIQVGVPPTVSITADYCQVAGKVVLQAMSSGVTYKWSTGQTTDTIQIDVSGVYTVTVTNPAGCKASASLNVSQELVTNGDFSAGNTGFTTGFPYKTAPGSLSSPPGYAVDTAAHHYANFLWGKDHTTGHGKFMMINGTDALIWQQTVNVLPNTTYYFSAWGLEIDDLCCNPANANLQFNVNGQQVGTIGILLRPNNPQRDEDNVNWVRFYGTWTSGPTTTSAVISITDLQNAVYGNNFGLDDISFATLSTFLKLISAPGTDAQTVCVNSPIQDIVYAYGNGSSNPTVTGLPTGVSVAYTGDQLTISGTPTVAGNYTYKITTTGCQPYSVTGTITVNAQKLTLSSGSATQTVCINTPISNIVYTASGPVTNVIVKGLPTNLTGTYNSGTKAFTISGTPNVAGIFKDTVITTGTCRPDTAYGTITVNNQSIVLSSGDTVQTICANTDITPIEYTLGGTATSASATGLPSGVTGFLSGTSYILSGTATTPGTYQYKITTTGTCAPGATTTGTITVNPSASIVLISAPGTDAQIVCTNQSLSDIKYQLGGTATTASITSGALPAGVTGSLSGGVFTISGTPTVAGVFNYTITAEGDCAEATVSGSITVNQQTITLTSGSASPTLCIGSTLTPIVFTVGGTATGATLTGTLPTGVTGSYNAGTKKYTISGSPGQLGTFNYTVTTTGTCTPGASFSGTITVNTGSVGGNVNSFTSKCSGDNVSFNLTGQTGTVQRWETSTDAGVTWTNIANTSTTLNTPVTAPTLARALVKSGSCNAVYSNTGSVTIHNYWTGTNSTDWNTASNWSDNQVASGTCNMYTIPAGTPYSPKLGSNTIVQILNIALGANVDLNDHKLTVNGSFMGGGNLSGSAKSELEVNGNAGTVRFNKNNPYNQLKALTINSGGTLTLGGNVASGDTLNITGGNSTDGYGKVIVTGTLNANGILTLKSDANGTAMVGQSTGSINGNVTVERYIPPLRAWRFLTVPFSSSSQTVWQAWQEGVNNYGLDYNIYNKNPKPGYGTHITGDNNSNLGYDFNTTQNPSYKVWDPVANTWRATEPPTISTPIISYNHAYCIFVRGSRAVNLSLATSAPTDPTVLRATGVLNQTGPTATRTYPGAAGKFVMIGNPYASTVNLLDVVHRSTGIDTGKFWVWDPKIVGSGTDNVGAYVSYRNGILVPNNSPSFPNVDSIKRLQSGQAFMVQLNSSSSSVTMDFRETDKMSDERNVFGLRHAEATLNTDPVIFTNLMLGKGTDMRLVDGVGVAFNTGYSTAVGAEDAEKLWNFDENIALARDGKSLAIEFRPPIDKKDTLYYNLYLKQKSYTMKIFARNLAAGSSTEAWLIDKFLNKKITVNLADTTLYSFKPTTDIKSYRDRFILVFKGIKGAVVPQQNEDIADRATVSIAGTVKLYPNPVSTNKVSLQFANMDKGNYEVTVYSPNGQKLASRKIQHNGGTTVYPLALDATWAAGVYNINIINEDSKKPMNLNLVISK